MRTQHTHRRFATLLMPLTIIFVVVSIAAIVSRSNASGPKKVAVLSSVGSERSFSLRPSRYGWRGLEPPTITTTVATTTTTRPAPSTTKHVVQRPAQPVHTGSTRNPAQVAPSGSGGVRSIHSTAYAPGCGASNPHTKSGETPHVGGVASVVLPMGTSWKVLTGPMAGNTYTVNDTGGPAATFDIYMTSCAAANNYGNPQITIQQV